MRVRTDLIRGSAGDAIGDLAVTEALLVEVGAGVRGDTLRVYVPQSTVAFGRVDARATGFEAAAAAASAHGYTPVRRTVGGHAAAFDAGSVVVEHVTTSASVAAGLERRYEQASWRMTAMLRRLGADARVGELPGEYCPGRWSVHLGARAKVVGIAQRVTRSAALVSCVVVVGGGPAIRACLVDVYAALGLALDPQTVGAVDEHVPDAGPPEVVAGVEAVHAETLDLRDVSLSNDLLRLAEGRRDRHRVLD